ncbi:MAG: cysteine synthase A [Firmicutes bacterium]|nr:cysteine synthase A [Bacillota bacterium]
MKVYNNLLELIGNTPVLKLSGFNQKYATNIFAKLEFYNPGKSVKDRIAYAMIKDAEKKGLLKSGHTIIEPTSGNTGIGLSMICAVLGYKLILVMPENMSVERQKLMQIYGAQIELTNEKSGMKGAIDRALKLNKTIKNSIILDQFNNAENQKAHERTTASEILQDLDNKIDYFVAGVGTGGTLSGVGRVLKQKLPGVKIIAVEPEGCAVLSKGILGIHSIQGIGAGFIPKNLDMSIIDEIVAVSDECAFNEAKSVAKTDGLIVGISSGAALYASRKISLKNSGKNIITLFPDSAEKYLSTKLFE